MKIESSFDTETNSHTIGSLNENSFNLEGKFDPSDLILQNQYEPGSAIDSEIRLEGPGIKEDS